MLSDSLTDFEKKGLVERTVVNETLVRDEYSLTRHGRELEEVITALKGWGGST